MYDLSESDMRLGCENEFDGNSEDFSSSIPTIKMADECENFGVFHASK